MLLDDPVRAAITSLTMASTRAFVVDLVSLVMVIMGSFVVWNAQLTL